MPGVFDIRGKAPQRVRSKQPQSNCTPSHTTPTRRVTQMRSTAQGASSARSDKTQSGGLAEEASISSRRPSSKPSDTSHLPQQQHHHQTTDPSGNASASSSSRTPSSRSRTSRMQRSQNPSELAAPRSIAYTRTGRISKAKKGVKGAHACACGKVPFMQPRPPSNDVESNRRQSYSRAEHLRYA